MIALVDQMLSFQDGQFDQVLSYMSVDPSRDKNSSHSDHPNAEPSTTTCTTVIQGQQLLIKLVNCEACWEFVTSSAKCCGVSGHLLDGQLPQTSNTTHKDLSCYGYSCLLIVVVQKNFFFVIHTAKQLELINKTDDIKMKTQK